MLIQFIIRARKPNSDAHKTVNSFIRVVNDKKVPMFIQAIQAENVQHTQRLLKKLESEVNFQWYGILYDNEHISVGLNGSLSWHLETDYDVLQVIKDDGGHIQSPRFFRKAVMLPEESLMPSKLQVLRYSLVMDGWIRPHKKD